MATNYGVLHLDKKVEKITYPEFTHVLDKAGNIVEKKDIAQGWENVMLLPEKREEYYQFLVWDIYRYYILLSKDKGTVFNQ